MKRTTPSTGSNRYTRQPRSRRQPARSMLLRRLRFGLLLAVLLGINAYVFFFRGGTSIRDLLQASSVKGKAAAMVTGSDSTRKRAEPAANGSSVPLAIRPIRVRGSMRGHMGLASALEAAGVKPEQATELYRSLRGVLDLRALQPQQRFELQLHARTRQLLTFDYHISPIISVAVRRGADGQLRAQRSEVEFDVEIARVAGTVKSSLNKAMTDAGESSALVNRFVDLFAWDVNWFVDPRVGDEFRVVVEKKRHGGSFFGYGHVLAAEYRNGDRRYQAYFYTRKAGEGGYYTAEGRSIRRAYLKTPLTYRRVSSHFNKHRFHPVLHRTRGHYGVDYAAPRGTPVKAAADGVVLRAEHTRGAGNMVVLRHANGVRTVYMHLNHFARGLQSGQSVKQGQLIGAVGSTGLATGPHLHYGIYVNGRPIDPQKFHIPEGPRLPLVERARFYALLLPRVAELEAVGKVFSQR